MTNIFGGRDPTRPIAPAFTKMTPQIDISQGPGGMLNNPVLFARLGKMPRQSGRKRASSPNAQSPRRPQAGGSGIAPGGGL